MNSFKGFLPILLVLVIIGGGYFFSYPQYTGLNEARAKLALEQQRNDQLREDEAAIDNFLKQYRSLSNQSEQANKMVPFKKTDIQNVVTNVETFAATSGVSVSNISLTDSSTALGTKADHKIAYVELNMTVLGTYPSFKAFLDQVEKTSRLMDITSINVQTEAASSTNLRYNLLARVYYQN